MQELRETFHVELSLAATWRRLRVAVEADDDSRRCRIPGFPSMDGGAGCAATIVESEAQRRLLAVKEDAPCQGSKIAIEIGPANASGWPTRVSVEQSELPPPMAAMPDAVVAHWRMIVADFRLYVEREVVAPPVRWGPDFGALTEQTPLGLVLSAVGRGGFAARCGMCDGDLLLTLGGVRVRSLEELWAVLAVAPAEKPMQATWVRDGDVLSGAAQL